MAFSGRWKPYGCCPYDGNNIPSPPQNLMEFEVAGYAYRSVPIWFDSTGQRMIPLQFSMNFNSLIYRFSFYKKTGSLCSNTFHLSTSDDIVPIIHEIVTGKEMNVTRIAKHNGYTNWSVTC